MNWYRHRILLGAIAFVVLSAIALVMPEVLWRYELTRNPLLALGLSVVLVAAMAFASGYTMGRGWWWDD